MRRAAGCRRGRAAPRQPPRADRPLPLRGRDAGKAAAPGRGGGVSARKRRRGGRGSCWERRRAVGRRRRRPRFRRGPSSAPPHRAGWAYSAVLGPSPRRLGPEQLPSCTTPSSMCRSWKSCRCRSTAWRPGVSWGARGAAAPSRSPSRASLLSWMAGVPRQPFSGSAAPCPALRWVAGGCVAWSPAGGSPGRLVGRPVALPLRRPGRGSGAGAFPRVLPRCTG